jgi:hypothetical protein
VNELAWQVFVANADRGLLFGLETDGRTDEAVNDAFVERARWLLPENEYGLRIVRTYVAPRLDAMSLRAHFMDAIASKLPRRAERLLLIVEGFELLQASDRIAHLETLRLALRMPNVIILVTTGQLDQRERKFFDRIDVPPKPLDLTGLQTVSNRYDAAGRSRSYSLSHGR